MNNSLVGIFKKLGKLTELKTQNKESLVSSINEIADKTNGIDTVKNQVLNSVKSVEAGLNYNTIKITKNDGSTENVMIKVQGGASDSINVFKSSQKGGSFVATEVTSTFTIEDLDTTKDVDLIYNNLFLVKDVDYMVDKESKTVVLGFDLDINEIVYYILTNTSYDYNDLNNLPDLNLKVDKSQIKNTLTETQVGGVLDATQGKVLNDKMGDTTQLLTVDKTSLVNAINELKRTGGGGGATLNVFKSTSGVWGEYVAQSQTNTFTIDNYNSTEKTVDLYYESVLLIPGKLFTISPIGEVTLSFQLDVGETIDYCISDVSFDYNELANKPNLDLKADKSYVDNKDSLLQEQLTSLVSGDTPAGALNITTLGSNLDMNDLSLFKLGKVVRVTYDAGTSQTPYNTPYGEMTNGYSFVTSYNVFTFGLVNRATQIATSVFSSNYNSFIRYKHDNTWTKWQQIATTTKTAFSCTPSSGYSINQYCYMLNGEFCISLSVTKTDGSAFAIGNNTIATLPIAPKTTYIIDGMGRSTGAYILPVNGFVQPDKTITVVATQPNTTQIYLSCKGGIV